LLDLTHVVWITQKRLFSNRSHTEQPNSRTIAKVARPPNPHIRNTVSNS